MDAEVLINIGLNAGDVAKQLNDVTAAIVKCKAEQKLLNEQLKNGEITSVEYEQSMAAVKDEMSALTKEQKGLVAQQKILTEDSKSYADTLNGQRQRLNDLTKAYDSLDASMRDSSAGQAFRDQIREQSEAIQELEEATNRHQRNVGNYPKTITSIIPGFDKMNGVLGKLGTSMEQMSSNGGKAFSNLGKSVTAFGKAFITPPMAVVTAVLSAIVLVITKVVDAFKKNDDAMTALQKAFSAFQPIIDIVTKAFDLLATGIAAVVGWMADGVKAVLSLIPGYEDAADAAEALVQAQDDLEEAERQYTVNSARRNKEIAKLRDEVAESKDVTERMKKLREAQALEEQNLQDELKIQAEKLRIMEETAKREQDTSDETKNKIADARAAMEQAEQKYYEGHRKLQKEYNKYQNEAIKGLSKQRQELYLNISAQLEQAEATRTQLKATLDLYVAMTKDTSSTMYKLMTDKLKSLDAEIAEETKKVDALLKESERNMAKTSSNRVKAKEDDKKAMEKLAADLEKVNNKILDDDERTRAELKKRYDEDAATLQSALDKKLISQEEYYIKLQALEVQYFDTLEANEEKRAADEEAKLQEKAKKAAAEEEFLAQTRLDIINTKKAETEEEELVLEQERFEAERNLANIQLEQTLMDMSLSEEQKQAIRDKFAAEEEAAEQAHEDNLTNIKKKGDAARLKAAQAQMKAQADLLGNLGDALMAFGEDNEEAAKAAKILNVGKVMMESGVALATGIAQSQDIPFPGNLAAMAATIAAITTNMVTAIKQVESAKFAAGGIVPGTYDAKDSVRASLSGGEMVLNPAQQKKLFEVANVGMSESFDYERMAAAVAVGVSELPAPVLDYKEFTTFEDNVAVVDELSRI